MVRATLLVDALLILASALLYAYVGRIIRARPVSSDDAKRARNAFTTWWYGIAAITVLSGVRAVLASFDVLDVGLHATLSYLAIPPLAACLWGLVHYLTFIYTGHSRWASVVLGAHVLLGIFFLALVAWMRPVSVTVSDWSTSMDYANDLTGPLLLLVIALLLGPVLFVSAAYFTLAFRVQDPLSRFRIFTVSGGFLLWFGSAAVAAPLGWSRWYWWPLVSRGIALVATLIILSAYRPPRALRERMEGRESAGS